MYKFILFVALTFMPWFSTANSQESKVAWLMVRASDGLVYFALEGGTRNNRPSCATSGYWMIKDENSTAGKQQYSMILSAHASGKKVRIYGAGKCSRWSDGEDVDALMVLN
ncbi:hypothetical protein HG263_16535 [Pseudoalteromonas sp. JBTF-M23]|uniref:Uncharacterized protein n=1 Tax=Pseudoalteromonas caenipelagi TaxID=2726988 RepID=A0A849VHF4_9GAMM|nr:hypothetical protein [Pseudoalteromonas caenipelagi]NOU52138.1 hypothetical protein [Pseudoalteromonas caenipelagi]